MTYNNLSKAKVCNSINVDMSACTVNTSSRVALRSPLPGHPCSPGTIYLPFVTVYLFSFSRILYKWNHYMYSFFGEGGIWLHYLSINILRFIHVVPSIHSLFLFIVNKYLIAWIYHSPIRGHLGCFYFGIIINKATANIWVPSLNGHVSSFLFGKYLRVHG